MLNCEKKSPAAFESPIRRGLAALPGVVLAAALSAPATGLAAAPNPERNAYFG